MYVCVRAFCTNVLKILRWQQYELIHVYVVQRRVMFQSVTYELIHVYVVQRRGMFQSLKYEYACVLAL